MEGVNNEETKEINDISLIDQMTHICTIYLIFDIFGKHGKDGIFGKHGIFGKDGIFGKHGKGKKRSLMSVEERQDLNTLLRKGERRKRERCRNRREHT